MYDRQQLPREARRQPAVDRLAQVAGLRGCRRSASAAAHLYCHHLDAAVGYLDFLRQVVHLRQHPGGAAALGHVPSKKWFRIVFREDQPSTKEQPEGARPRSFPN